MADFREFLQEGTFPERKALIRNFVEGIEVVGDEAVLTYTIPMPSDGVTSESASVLDFVQSGPQRGTRTPSERQLNRQFPGSSTSQHNRSIELTLAEVIVQADSITTYSRVVTILSQEKLGRHFPADKKPGATHTIRIVSEVQT